MCLLLFFQMNSANGKYAFKFIVKNKIKNQDEKVQKILTQYL